MDKYILGKEMIGFAGTIRGIVIEGCIMIERAIDLYLSSYFTYGNGKQKELSHLLSRHITLENKRAFYMDIIKMEAKDEYKMHKSDLARIVRIIEERNIIAHMELDISEVAMDKFQSTGVIQFIKYRKAITAHEITDNMLAEFQENVPKAVKAMDIILNASIRGWEEERNKPI